MLLLLGVALRYPFDFFFPEQLAAFSEHPTLMTASYSIFAAGNILMWPAIITLAGRISGRRPGWALWGAAFTIFGLFARTFHAGIDHLAVQLVHEQSVELAASVIAGSYGAFHIFKTFNLCIMSGWVILAIGSYRAGALKLYQCVSLALMASLPLGVLKGSTLFSLIATVGLCIALIPLGIKVLAEGSRPSAVIVISRAVMTIVLIGLFFLFGQAG
ncbi:hypothetical protein KZ483_04680 [Paenibacillus sp. sptzw28]|nr:hypothetical protein KZ483_04680 [Paenibacillus sp. sptzw28]